MLQTMRDNAQGMIAKIIVGFIIIVFALWGVESIVSIGGGAPATASVDGIDITEADIARTVEQQKANLRRQFGDQYDENLFNEQFLRQSALEQLIEQKVSLVQAKELGLRAAPRTIDESIVTIPAFQLDGRFNREQFQNVLRLNGLTPLMFRENIAEDLITSQARAGFILSSLETPFAAQFSEALNQEERTFRFVEINARDLEKEIVTDEESIVAAYEASRDRYRTPEQASVRYVQLRRADLMAAQTVEEDELQAAYADYVERESVREQRRLRHVLLETNGDRSREEALQLAAELRSRIVAGESFESIAQEYSDDFASRQEGGDLGLNARGNFVEAFDAAAFNLAEAEVSDPVETEYGIHLIRVDAIVKPSVRDLASMRDELSAEIRAAKAEPAYAEQLQELSNIAFSAESLEDIAAALKLQVEESGVFTRDQGAGVAAESAVRQMAFSDNVLLDKEISPVVELEDRALVMVVASHAESSVRPLDEVRDQVTAAWKREQALALARARAEAVIAGTAEIAGWKTVTTTFAQPGDAPRQAQQRAFALLSGQSDSVATAAGYTVVTLESVSSKNWQDVTAATELTEAGRAQNSRADLLSYQTWSRAVSDIER